MVCKHLTIVFFLENVRKCLIYFKIDRKTCRPVVRDVIKKLSSRIAEKQEEEETTHFVRLFHNWSIRVLILYCRERLIGYTPRNLRG